MNAREVTLEVELSCLSSQNIKVINADVNEDIQQALFFLLDQNYVSCLNICLKVDDLFASYKTLKEKITLWDHTKNRKFWLFACGVSCLQLFVQLNWTGPAVDGFYSSIKLQNEARSSLCEDDQQVHHLAQSPHLLLAAKMIFSTLSEDSEFQTAPWWLFRCLCIQSQILQNLSESLYKETKNIIKLLLESSYLQLEVNRSLLFQCHLEVGLLLLYYYDYKEADKHFETSRKLSGIEFGFTGALGVRTRFQLKPVSQLQMSVKRKTSAMRSMISVKSKEIVPKNLSLDDDTLLNNVKLVDENEINNPDLSPEEYCMILAACTAMQKTNPAHRIQQEKVQTVIEFLLCEPSCWCVHAEALRLRCLNEKDSSRTVERSMMQLDNLVGIVKEKQASSITRLDLFYSVRPPPIWILQKDLAKLYISLGATSSALQIYERLEMWEDAVLCLIRSSRNAEAMQMIRKQLELNETANLWCLLGDILQEPKHYLKAWQISNGKSSRAMKSLGCYYISMKEFEKAVECFEKSLHILTLQVDTWFTLGCALLRLEKYEKASDAFRRCVNLDWDNYEAWTNLSASYVRSNKKDQAYKALSEAIKCNFDKWQLWENFVALCCDVGQFVEAVTAYSRLLDLKHKFVDVPVLSVLVRAVVEDIPDAGGNSGSALKKKLTTLFGHVTSLTTGEPRIWELYARLYGDGIGENEQENEKAIQFLHKAIRSESHASGWEKDGTNIKNIRENCSKLANACLHSHDHLSSKLISSVRLTINGISSKLKQRERLMINADAQESMRKDIQCFDGCLNSLNQVLIEMKKP